MMKHGTDAKDLAEITNSKLNLLEEIIGHGLDLEGLSQLLIEWTLAYAPTCSCELILWDPRGPEYHFQGCGNADGIQITDRSAGKVGSSSASWQTGRICVERRIRHQAIELGRMRVFNPSDAESNHPDPAPMEKLARQFGYLLYRYFEVEQVRDQAVRDELTGLHNRRFFLEALERRLETHRTRDGGLTLLLIDIDEFKMFNDTWGHEVGDQVLTTLAEVMRDVFRGEDVICRYGGEEFTVLFADERGRPGRYRVRDAYCFAERLRRNVADLRLTSIQGEQLAQITISGGLATFPDDAADAGPLIRKADELLYQAKREGRNRICTTETFSAEPILIATHDGAGI